MVWSFINFIPQVMKEAHKIKTKNGEILLSRLKMIITVQTGIYNDKKLIEYLKILRELGFIDVNNGNVRLLK